MKSPARTGKFPLQLDQLAPGSKTVVSVPSAGGSQRPLVAPVSSAASSQIAQRAVLRPQAPLRHAAEVASRPGKPTGLGLDSDDVRRRMVLRLRESGLRDESVLTAIEQIPRHRFVDGALVTQAYEDTSLPIGHGQTISKPSVVGRMIELLMAGRTAQEQGRLGRLLEVGTGCGYQAAVLSLLALQVVSVERLKPLHDKARELLAPLRLGNLRLVHGDGMLGHLPSAPYDSIISAAGGESLPESWLEQLAVGGRLVAPVGESLTSKGSRQMLVVVDKTETGIQRTVHEAVHFVPLKSGTVR